MALKFIEKKFKRIALRLIAGISKPDTQSIEDIKSAAIRKIVVIRQDNRIGNLIFTIPLIKALKEDFPDAKIDLVAGFKFKSIIDRLPELDKVIQFNQRKAAFNIFYYLSFRRSLKNRGYDLVIDAGSMTALSTNNILLGAAAKARYYVGYGRKNAADFLTTAIPQIDSNLHESQQLLHLANYISGKSREIYPMFAPTEGEKDEAELFLSRIGVVSDDKLIGMHIGGRYDKRWDTDNFIKIAELIKGKGLKTLLFSGPDEREILNDSNFEPDDSIIHIDSAPMGLVIGLMARCSLFVTGDTGPMHIAAALGVPCVQIFRVGNSRRYGYHNAPHEVVEPFDPSYFDVKVTLRNALSRLSK